MLRKPKILVVGSFMMDLIASTPKAPVSGETVIGTDFRTAPGGKGANQAVQCARLGAEVTMAGQVGADAFGREMTETAKRAGVDVSHVLVDPNKSSGVGHIVLEVTEHGAQNRITVVPGANYSTTVEQIAWLKDEIGRFDLVMLQLEIPMEINIAVAQYAKAAGVPVMLNPAPAAELPVELLSCVTYLSPNEHEAAAIAGLPLRADESGVNEADMEAVSAALREKGRGECDYHIGRKRLRRGRGQRSFLYALREDAGCEGPHRCRRLFRGGVLHRRHRGTARDAGAGFCQSHGRYHRVPDGGDAVPAHDGRGAVSAAAAGVYRVRTGGVGRT